MAQEQNTGSGFIPPVEEEEAAGSGSMIFAMGMVGSIAAVLIVFTYQFTLPFIIINKANYLNQSVYQVMPGATAKTAFEVDASGTLVKLADENDPAAQLYLCYASDGSLAGAVVKASGQGFQDVVRIIYGYSPQTQKIVGMKVLESTETPGLGDKIEKDQTFLDNFRALDVALAEDGKALLHPLELVKPGQKSEAWQISAITGATVSSRAVFQMLTASTEKSLPVITRNLAQKNQE